MPNLELAFAAGTDTGKMRHHNEDSFATFVSPCGSTYFFMIADGMGGHNAGDAASMITAAQFIKKLSKADTDSMTEAQLRALLVKIVRDADRKVYRESIKDPAKAGMGTTAVLCAVREGRLIAANVGDSRAYISRPGGIEQITVDHSYVEELVREGAITREEARVHPRRNVITRAVGAGDNDEVDTFTIDFMPGEVLLMCSDGLYSMVEDGRMQRLIRRNRNMDKLVARLTAEANRCGGIDNITVIAARRRSEVR